MDFQKALIQQGVDAKTAKQFIAWHLENKQVWKLFETLTLKTIRAGVKKFGAKALMEVVRWKFKRQNPNADFAVNNNYTSYYARIFILKYPEHRSFFEVREVKGLTSLKEAA